MLRKIRRNRLVLFLVVASLLAGVVVVKMSKDSSHLKFLNFSTDEVIEAEDEDTEITKSEEDTSAKSEDKENKKSGTSEKNANEDIDEEEEMEEKGIDTGKNSLKRLPNVFILGAEKSGATPLTAFIGLHPNVVTVHGKDINFFGDPSNYEKGIDWYKSKLPDVTKDQILIENSPDYFYSTTIPEMAKEVYPSDDSLKLVIIVRDPVKRLISEYADVAARMKANGITPESFNNLVIDQKAMLVNTSYTPVVRGVYATGLVHWAKYFTRDQTHFVDGDQFITNPIVELRKLENFLGIGHKITDDQLYFNSTSGFFCMKTPEGKSRCYMRPPGWEKPDIDKKFYDIIRHFYVHHNDKFFLLSRQHYDWLSN